MSTNYYEPIMDPSTHMSHYPFNSYEVNTPIQAFFKAMEDFLNDDNTIEESELFMENERG